MGVTHHVDIIKKYTECASFLCRSHHFFVEEILVIEFFKPLASSKLVCMECQNNVDIIRKYIRESVDSLCRDGADAQYMQYLSKIRITSPQTR